MKAVLPLAFGVFLILTGCKSTLPLANELQPGMIRPEVINLLGKPASTTSPGPNTEILRFILTEHRAFIIEAPLKTEYFVRLVGGEVDAYGSTSNFTGFLPNSAAK